MPVFNELIDSMAWLAVELTAPLKPHEIHRRWKNKNKIREEQLNKHDPTNIRVIDAHLTVQWGAEGCTAAIKQFNHCHVEWWKDKNALLHLLGASNCQVVHNYQRTRVCLCSWALWPVQYVVGSNGFCGLHTHTHTHRLENRLTYRGAYAGRSLRTHTIAAKWPSETEKDKCISIESSSTSLPSAPHSVYLVLSPYCTQSTRSGCSHTVHSFRWGRNVTWKCNGPLLRVCACMFHPSGADVYMNSPISGECTCREPA